MIIVNRGQVNVTSDDSKAKRRDPAVEEMMHKVLEWIDDEVRAKRIESSEVLLDSSEETDIRVEFHDPDTVSQEEQEKNDKEPEIPHTDPSVKRGGQIATSTDILGFYTVEFPTKDEVVAWARSCPLSYEGVFLEIRELHDRKGVLNEATEEVKQYAGDQILFMRKQLSEEGKLKTDEDGTMWIKVEEEQGVKEIVADAEKREAKNEEE